MTVTITKTGKIGENINTKFKRKAKINCTTWNKQAQYALNRKI